jgi:ectoine hydroxylase-related dioxygenase (phytanoyl-CoA dioxygenase family)
MIVDANRAVGTDVVDAYDRDGVICFRQLVPMDWVGRLREAVEMALQDESFAGSDKAAKAGKGGRFVGQGALFKRFPSVRAFTVQSSLAEVAARITRSRQVRIFDDGLFVKEPNTNVRTPWHQDIPYEQIDGMQTASAWVALDHVSAENGAVLYIAGSHKWGKLFIPVEFGTEIERPHRRSDAMTPAPDIDAEPDRYRIVSFDLQPGDVTFHNLKTVHGAGGNNSPDRRRRAYTLRMCGDDVVGSERPVNGRPEAIVRDGESLNDRDFPILWPRLDVVNPRNG